MNTPSHRTSLIRYPGGKSRLASEIVGRLAPHFMPGATYVEPFFGGGSVGLSFLEAFGDILRGSFVNDFNPSVASLWTSVIRQPERLKELVMGFKPSVEAFYEFKRELLAVSTMPADEEEMLELGFSKLAIHRISYSGLGEMSGSPLGGKGQVSAYKIDSRWNPVSLCREIDRAHRIMSAAGVVDSRCHCLDFRDVLGMTDVSSLVYLDPPYVEQGNGCYKMGFSTQDHRDLSDMLKGADYTWLLSYDQCQEIRELYDWTGIEEVAVKNSMRHKRLADGTAIAKLQNELLIGPALRIPEAAMRRVA